MLMLSELQTQIDSPHLDDNRKKARMLATKSLTGAMDTCAKLVVATKSEAPRVQIPKGDVHALGVEAKVLGDDKLSASSGDAKRARLNGPNCWIAAPEDATPWLKVDLGGFKLVESVLIQGGVVGGSSVLSDAPLVLTKTNMDMLAKLYDPVAVTGDHQQTYDIAKYVPTYPYNSHILSWTGLLKTAQVPTKLFSRPPVRFLHDVITLVVANTAYGQSLFTDKEKDYSQLTDKKDKSEYLVKVLHLVASSFQGVVEIKATESNILAGKEPDQTMQFLALFCLGAIRHLAATLPEETNHVADAAAAATPPPPVETRQAWVTDCDVECSVDGDTWTKVAWNGSSVGSADAFTAVATKLPQPTVARYVKFVPTKWNVAPAMRCEVLGFKLTEKDDTLADVQAEGVHYLGLLTTLFTAGELILDEARVKWKKAKDVQREKQAELKHVLVEIDTWKSQVAALKAELEGSNKALDKCKTDKADVDKQLTATTAKWDAATVKCTSLEEQQKKTKASLDAMTSQFHDATKEATSWKQQHVQVLDQLKSMGQSKAELEKLIETLRGQLTSKSAMEGATDSKLATLSADLQSVTIQLDETKRSLQRSEKAAADGLVERDGLQTQLALARTALTSKDEALEALEAKLKTQLGESHAQLDAAQASLAEATNKHRDIDAQLQKAVAHTLALQADMENAKQRGVESTHVEVKRLHDEAVESEKRVFQMQAQQVRLQADNERLEAKYASVEEKVKVFEAKQAEFALEVETLQKERKQLVEQEEELQLQLQVVTDERDSARQKEEQLFVENAEKEQEIERIRDGYVWVTDRMNNKEDELAELQDQLEKYQSVLKLAGDLEYGNYTTPGDIQNQLLQWIQNQHQQSPYKGRDPQTKQDISNGVPPLPSSDNTSSAKDHQDKKAAPLEDFRAGCATTSSPKLSSIPIDDAKSVDTVGPHDRKDTPPSVSNPPGSMSSQAKSLQPPGTKDVHDAKGEAKGADVKGGDTLVSLPSIPQPAPPLKTTEKCDMEAKTIDGLSGNGGEGTKAASLQEGLTPTKDTAGGPSLGPALATSATVTPPKKDQRLPPTLLRRDSIEDLMPAIQDTAKTNPDATEVADEYDDDFDAYDDENSARRGGKSKRRSVDKATSAKVPVEAPVEPVSEKTLAQHSTPSKTTAPSPTKG
ncbi:hypothetical protein DYB26_009585 [Aphanomyces astaci]|uniref:F5/8 type C domain-containing protein n=1 Tax=Aphanomyces astaci TaxID=112090 RepID=A0A3R6Y4S5_APHAT|nr:hypothetical protein DYB26_009585 [Aphanomyces astaci]